MLDKVMKEIRQNRKMTARDMSIILGITPSYLTHIEKGRRAIPKDFIQKINNVCQLNTIELNSLNDAINNIAILPINESARKQERIYEIKRELLQLTHKLIIDMLNNSLTEEIINSLKNLLERIKLVFFQESNENMKM